MYRKLIFSALVFLCANVGAETLICHSKVISGLENTTSGNFNYKNFNPADLSLVLTDSSGKWMVSEKGNDYPEFDSCIGKFFCENKALFGGFFMLDKNNHFTYARLKGSPTGDNTSVTLLSAKGICNSTLY